MISTATPTPPDNKKAITTPISTGGPARESIPTGELSDYKKPLQRKLSYGVGLSNSPFPNSPTISLVQHLLPRQTNAAVGKFGFPIVAALKRRDAVTIDNAYKMIQKLADQSIYVMKQKDNYEKTTTLSVDIERAQNLYEKLLSSAKFKQDENYHVLSIKAQHSEQVAGEYDARISIEARNILVEQWKKDKKALEAKILELKISNNPHLGHLDGVIRKACIMSYMGGNGDKSEAESNLLLAKLEKNLRILPTVKIPSQSDESWHINAAHKRMLRTLKIRDENYDVNILRQSLMEMEIIQKFGRAMMDSPEQVAEFNATVEDFKEDSGANISAGNSPQQIQQLSNSLELESLKLKLVELEGLLRQERLKASQAQQEVDTHKKTILALRREVSGKEDLVNAENVELARRDLAEIIERVSSPEIYSRIPPRISPRIFSEAPVNKSDAETQTLLSEKLPGVETVINTDEYSDKSSVVEEKEQADFSHIATNVILENVIPKIMVDAKTQTQPHQLNVEELNERLKFESIADQNKFRHALWKVVKHNKTLTDPDSKSFEEFWKDIRKLTLPDRKAITKFALKINKEASNSEDIKQIFTVINQFIEIMGPEKMTQYLEGFRDEGGAPISQKKTRMPITIITGKEGDSPVNLTTTHLESPIGVPLKALILQR